MEEGRSLILVVNPGSSSRKYALFNGEEKLVDINFEYENNQIIAQVITGDAKQRVEIDDCDLNAVAGCFLPLATERGIVLENDKIKAIGVRLVAPSQYFTEDRLVDDRVIEVLEGIQKLAPLHIGTALTEIKQLKTFFPATTILTISDSAFHSGRPDHSVYYGFDTELADKLDLKRFGYHGLSIESVVYRLQQEDKLLPKTIVCHLGSGSSLTALLNGKSLETTMGYTPLEGLMMATRCGNIDPAAVLTLKHKLDLPDDEIENYLNKQCGLLGVSGKSNDIRQLLELEKQGHQRSKLALDILVYRIQMAIGQLASSLDGVDQLVFTATVGERSDPIRQRVLEKLTYLGFDLDKAKNKATFEPREIVNLGTKKSKPILVCATNESTAIARRILAFK